MTQAELNREVARQTDETIRNIKALGFSLLSPSVPVEERLEPLTVDWDEYDPVSYTHLTLPTKA